MSGERERLAAQHRDELNRIVAVAISRERLDDALRHRLTAACRRAGVDYNEVVEHIGAEIAANAIEPEPLVLSMRHLADEGGIRVTLRHLEGEHDLMIAHTASTAQALESAMIGIRSYGHGRRVITRTAHTREDHR